MTPTTGAERAAALDAALAVLACPVCLAALGRDGASLVCRAGHRHDVARQGYASLAAGTRMHGDTATMVAARSAFLAAGHFAAVESAVVERAPEEGWCVDLAGGPGHYVARVLEARPGLRGVGLDLAAAAARAAAGAHARLAAATADVWRTLPLRDGSADLLLDVFGPRNGAEFARVLAPGGALVVVTPLPEHLAELREPFGTLGIAEGKDARTDERLAPLRRTAEDEVVTRVVLPPEDAARAVLMGPNGHHLDAAAVAARAEEVGQVEVAVAVRVATLRH